MDIQDFDIIVQETERLTDMRLNGCLRSRSTSFLCAEVICRDTDQRDRKRKRYVIMHYYGALEIY